MLRQQLFIFTTKAKTALSSTRLFCHRFASPTHDCRFSLSPEFFHPTPYSSPIAMTVGKGCMSQRGGCRLACMQTRTRRLPCPVHCRGDDAAQAQQRHRFPRGGVRVDAPVSTWGSIGIATGVMSGLRPLLALVLARREKILLIHSTICLHVL